jgi:hypothetical protein
MTPLGKKPAVKIRVGTAGIISHFRPIGLFVAIKVFRVFVPDEAPPHV